MAANLSRTQLVFLVKILEGKSVPRTSLNQTGKGLEKRGLVRYVNFWGWSLTPAGIEVASANKDILDELTTQWQ